MDKARAIRKKSAKENGMRARIALEVIAAEFNKVKVQFVNNGLSKETMSMAHTKASRKVASVR